jgi:PAS domain S-box-containing protein
MRWLPLRWLPRTLAGRVFALYALTLGVMLAGGLGLFYRHQFTTGLAQAQQRAEALAAVLSPSVSDSAVIGDYDTIQRSLERVVDGADFAQAEFIDLRGATLVAPGGKNDGVKAPGWLRDAIAAGLYDVNLPITVGGRDYGVLRLRFDAQRVAGPLWEQTRIALVLGAFAMLVGLLVIRVTLSRWLGPLSRVQQVEEAVRRGGALPASGMLPGSTPVEFQETFEVLGRVAATLQAQRVQAAVTLGAITDAVFTLDAEGRVLLVNPAGLAMLGLPVDEVVGRSAAALMPEVINLDTRRDPWETRRTTLVHADGRQLVVDTTLSPITDPEGRTAGHVLACRDVSEEHELDLRLRAETAVREAALVSLRQVLEGLADETTELRPHRTRVAGQDDIAVISALIAPLVRELKERGEQLGAIFTLSPDGFATFDLQHRVSYVSPAFLALTGLDEGQLKGADEATVEALLFARGPDDDAGGWQGFAAMRRTLRQARGTVDGDAAPPAPPRQRLRLERPTRRVLDLGLQESHGGAISQVLYLRDVTHETMVEQLKSEFLSTAAHELRTPMASIYGFAELLATRELPPERLREMARVIHRQSERMISILNELLDLSRIEARRGMDFRLETVSLLSLVEQARQDLSPPGGREPPRLLEGAADAPVRVDRQKLLQALGNVISNAYKYSPAGGDVTLRLVRGEGDDARPRIGVEVEDRGVGLTPEQVRRVGERFYRADPSGKIPGTGLGVTIVREILGLLGGEMALRSRPGEGTCVTLWLPLAPANTRAGGLTTRR